MDVAIPEWTEYQKKSGLDPLGMQNTSVGLYQSLLPGISNVTLRIRYYGFYAWLSAAYARRVRDTTPKTWQRFLRRAEALYALTAQRHGGETGVAGILWAQAKLVDPQRIVAFADDAEPGSPTHYLKQAWGAFGAAYGSQLFEIGVLAQARDHVIPVPSPGIGEELAHSFETELRGIGERYLEILEQGTVAPDDLDVFTAMSPSEISSGSEEQKLYEDLLFARTALQRPSDINRRDTMLLILSLSQQLNRLPEIADVRWAFYAGCLPNGTRLSLSKELDAHRRSWWAYQTNDLSHICFETLLKYMLDMLSAYPNGVPLRVLISEAVAEIRTVAGPSHPADWAEFLEQVRPASNAWSPENGDADLALTNSLMTVARQGSTCTGETAWLALRLLGTLHNRVRDGRQQIEHNFGGFDTAIFRSILTETKFLEAQLAAPFDQTIAGLFDERVIGRHLWIAMRKLRYQGDYTFLVEADNGKVRLRGMDGPVYTNPRVGSSLTFLRDIGLLNANGLTAQGGRCIGGLA